MTDMTITVATAAFASALETATMARRHGRTGTVRFACRNGRLVLTGPGAEAVVDASGHWTGAVLADAGMLRAVAGKLPNRAQIEIAFRDGRLLLGSFGIGAEHAPDAGMPVLLPMGSGGPAVLRAIAREGAPAVAASLSRKQIAEAQADLDTALDKAAAILRPYGVAEADLRALVALSLARR